MRRWWQGILTILLTGCAALPKEQVLSTGIQPGHFESYQAEESDQAHLDDLGPASELTGDVWLNAEKPLHLADLHGKVVLIDMWTFG